MVIESYFPQRKRTDVRRGGGGGGGKTGMSGQALPRKRFRRRGPGLLTSDTDLQKRLNALMRQTNSEEVLLSLGLPSKNPERQQQAVTNEGNPNQTYSSVAEFPFDPKMLERLPERQTTKEGVEVSDKSDGRDLLYRLGFVVSGEDCASEGKDLLSLTLSPSRQVALNSARSTAVQSHSQSGNGEASSSSSLKGRKKVDKSALPALLRSKINGRPSVIRLLRKRHFRSYNRLLYDFPRKGSAGHEDDQLQDEEEVEEDEGEEDEEEEEDGGEERHRALDMLLGAAEVMKKEEGKRSKGASEEMVEGRRKEAAYAEGGRVEIRDMEEKDDVEEHRRGKWRKMDGNREAQITDDEC